MEIGFIGLGDQGAPIAERIVGAGWPLTVWARRPEATDDLARRGASVASSPAELASRSDLVGICVVGDDDVREVVDQLVPGLRPNGIVVVHSTVAPTTCVEVGERLAAIPAAVLDAPVSGGRPRAQRGELSVMVGGDPATYARARPVFESFGVPEWLGPLGSGQLMKVLNNALLMAHLLLADRAVRLAVDVGIDAATAERLLMAGSGASSAMSSRLRFRELDMARVRTLLAKDFRLFAAVAERYRNAAEIDTLARELLVGMEDGTWG